MYRGKLTDKICFENMILISSWLMYRGKLTRSSWLMYRGKLTDIIVYQLSVWCGKLATSWFLSTDFLCGVESIRSSCVPTICMVWKACYFVVFVNRLSVLCGKLSITVWTFDHHVNQHLRFFVPCKTVLWFINNMWFLYVKSHKIMILWF